MYWQRGCHDPPAGRPNYGPSASTQLVLHRQAQVLDDHKTLAEGCPARRYKTSQARCSHKTSRRIIIPSRTTAQASPPRNHRQARGRRDLLTSKQPSTTVGAPRVKGITATTFSSPYFAPRVDPTPPLWGYGRLLVLQ